MTHIVYTGGLKRELHHIRKSTDEDGGFEPALVILHHLKPGKSFIIPVDALWKYVDPFDNQDAVPSDMKDFMKLVSKSLKDRNLAERIPGEIGDRVRRQAREELQACQFASMLWDRNKILPCTGYNLAKLMQLFDIEPRPEAAAQILLFIQNGLDDLKDLPELQPEKELTSGEVTLWQGGTKVASRDLTVKESDLIIEGNE